MSPTVEESVRASDEREGALRLGTNMLTVEAGRSLTSGATQLPRDALALIMHLDNVELVTDIAL